MQIKAIVEISPGIEALIQQSRLYMADLYPADSIHQEDSSRLLESDGYFIGAYIGPELAGIAAVRKFDSNPRYGEIKNLFVDSKYRGRGVSRLIMDALEQHLVDQKIFISRLETGVSQPESIRLYSSRGYAERIPFGEYKPDPLSIFMQKELSDR